VIKDKSMYGKIFKGIGRTTFVIAQRERSRSIREREAGWACGGSSGGVK